MHDLASVITHIPSAYGGPVAIGTDRFSERKVGCDRALPTCVNCTKAKRECKGYGLKLAWPDKIDGRRKQKNYDAKPHVSATRYITRSGEFYFLNTSMEDVEKPKYNVQDLRVLGCSSVDVHPPSNVSLGYWKMDPSARNETLLSYCKCLDDWHLAYRLSGG